jgi:cytochrome b pre-mRNA-processing protein 3
LIKQIPAVISSSESAYVADLAAPVGAEPEVHEMFSGWFRQTPQQDQARALYLKIVAQARQPEFYRGCGVPDTVDGRFDLVALHAFLVLHRLKQDHSRTKDLAQALFDTMFLDMDQSLRELGAGDLGVGRRVKQMVQGLYGRIAAYQEGLDGPAEGLEEAIERNLYGTVTPDPAGVRAVADYLRREAGALAGQELAGLLSGDVTFGPPPDTITAPAEGRKFD